MEIYTGAKEKVKAGAQRHGRKDSEGSILQLSPPCTNTATIIGLLKIQMAQSVQRHDAPSHLEPTKQGEQSLLESNSRTLKDHSDKDGGLQLLGHSGSTQNPKGCPCLGLQDKGERNGIQAGGSVTLHSFTGMIRFYILHSTKKQTKNTTHWQAEFLKGRLDERNVLR